MRGLVGGFEIPDVLVERAGRRRGEQGVAWVQRLKHGLSSFAVEHDLEPVRRLQLGQELAVGYLVRGPDSRFAVLRAVEDREAVVRQSEVLTLWRDRPAVELGATVAGYQPQANVRVLHDPVGHPFCLYVGD